ncbi:MAG: trypsin-like peptidase domain-containing protein [Prevotella sp.]|nr:trypsin-like peptidase domain-containing protein [Prevotellaceae bacterium]MDY3935809.1 trypsin-like peptidase domain-containing protein [Prevotella sp.]
MNKLSKILVGASCVLALAFSTGAVIKVYAAEPPVAVPGQPVDLTYAAEKALPAVVHIKYVQNSKTRTVEVADDPFGGFFDFFGFGNPGGGTRQQQIQTPKRQATGSGVIISSDGYIVTNNHVVEGADELTVTLNDNREFSARIVGTDKNTDLALIKVNAKDLPYLAVGSSDNLKVGEWVIAVGNPYNLTNTVTAGIVSAKSRGLTGNGIESFIQTDAAINQGNSGGALVNTRGELVGINAMLYSQTGAYSGYGFAIPTAIMTKVVEDIKKYGNVQRVTLGIEGGDVLNYINAEKEKGKEPDLGTNEGVYVSKVSEEGNGADFGLQSKDVIIKFDGNKITKLAELQQALNGKRPGDKGTLTFLRNKKEITKTITLKNAQGTTKPLEQADIDVLGGQFRPVTDAIKKQLNINYGLEVIKINSGALKEAGVNRGFIIQNVNDSPVNNIESLQKIVKAASTSKDPVLYIKGIYPTGRKAYFAVPLSE